MERIMNNSSMKRYQKLNLLKELDVKLDSFRDLGYEYKRMCERNRSLEIEAKCLSHTLNDLNKEITDIENAIKKLDEPEKV